MAGKFLYRWLVPLLAGSILLASSCSRDEVAVEEGSADLPGNRLYGQVIRLDTLVFRNPVVNGEQVRFDLTGNPPVLNTGDIVYYPGRVQVCGKIHTLANLGSRMFFQLIGVRADEIFETAGIADKDGSLPVSGSFRRDPVLWNGDTMNFDNWLLKDTLWDSKSLKIKLLSGKLLTTGNSSGFLFTGQGTNPWFDRLNLDMDFSMLLNTQMEVHTADAIQANDSVLVRSDEFGPFDLSGFPILFRMETWVGFEVATSRDTVLNISLEGLTRGKASLRYNYWESWQFRREVAEQYAVITGFGGPRVSGYTCRIRVTQVLTPWFCGIPALSLLSRFEAGAGSEVSVPDWVAAQDASSSGRMIRRSDFLGAEVPVVLSSQTASLYSESQSGQIENQKPTASMRINPPAGFTDTRFEFDGTQSRDLETPLKQLEFRWDYDGDGHFDTEYAPSAIAYYTYRQPGVYYPALEVRDAGGLTSLASSRLEVTLSTSAPYAYFTVTPESGRVSDIFIFDAYGCFDAQDDVSLLKVRWDFDGDGIWETGWSTRKIEYFVYQQEGTYLAKLEVLDTQGLSSSTTRSITVSPVNIKPVATFTVTPSGGTTETVFNFDASGSTDTEDPVERLSVRWDWESDGFYDTEYRTVKTIQHRFTVAGLYVVTVEVLDSEGYGSTFSQEVRVVNPNTPPDADFTMTPPTGKVNETVTFDATVSTDLEDSTDILEVRWDWDNDNRYDTDYSTDKVVRKVFAEAGFYIIKVQVRDSGGLTDTRVKLLEVKQ